VLFRSQVCFPIPTCLQDQQLLKAPHLVGNTAYSITPSSSPSSSQTQPTLSMAVMTTVYQSNSATSLPSVTATTVTSQSSTSPSSMAVISNVATSLSSSPTPSFSPAPSSPMNNTKISITNNPSVIVGLILAALVVLGTLAASLSWVVRFRRNGHSGWCCCSSRDDDDGGLDALYPTGFLNGSNSVMNNQGHLKSPHLEPEEKEQMARVAIASAWTNEYTSSAPYPSHPHLATPYPVHNQTPFTNTPAPYLIPPMPQYATSFLSTDTPYPVSRPPPPVHIRSTNLFASRSDDSHNSTQQLGLGPLQVANLMPGDYSADEGSRSSSLVLILQTCGN